jgi:PTS system cellobiose-specific IIC component
MHAAGRIIAGWAKTAGEQSHLLSIRDGIVSALPLVLVGSLFLLIAKPPYEPWAKALEKSGIGEILLIPFRLTVGLVAVYVSFSVAASLARRYDADPVAAGLVSAAGFMLSARPFQAVAEGAAETHGRAPILALPMQALGAEGLFVAILIGLLSAELLRFFLARQWTFRLPAGVPPAVARSFASLAPAAVMLTLCWLVFHVLRLDLFALMGTAVGKPLAALSNTLPGVLLVVLIDSSLWLVGVHAVALLAVLQPTWLQLITQNMQAAERGMSVLPNIGSREFYIWFIWLGGSGASLCLPFMLLRARSSSLRSVARLALIPGICNINEPVMFGVPIVMNPSLAIPFILAPAALTLVTWFSFQYNLVMRPHIMAPWTLPAPVGAYLATGGDWRAVVLMAANFALAALIYIPFVRAYDAQLAEAETAGEAGKTAAEQTEPPRC